MLCNSLFLTTNCKVLYKSRSLCAFFPTFLAGFYTRQAYNQHRLKCSSCAIISSVHSAACMQGFNICVFYIVMTSLTIHTICSRICQPWLLFKSGLGVSMQLQKCGFYSKAAFTQDFTVVTSFRHWCSLPCFITLW